MPFQYTFRGSDVSSWEVDARDLVENRDRELELYSTTIDTSFLNLNASNLTLGTVPSARMTGAYTGITLVGTLSSLTVTGITTSGSFRQGTDYLSPYQGFRNKIINGDFSIWQRGGTGGYTPNSNAMEGADRWITWWNGTGGTRSVSRSTFALGQTAVPDNPKHHMTINTSVIGSGQSVTDFWQKVENVNTFAGQTATLSFWFKSTSAATQAWPFIVQNFGTGGSPSTAVDTFFTTVSVSSANTWTRYSATITLPSISGKTLGTSGDHIMIGIRFLTSVACTIDLSSVQLEQGSVATPFEQRPIGTELDLCFRYYQRMIDPAGVGVYTTLGIASRVLIPLYTKMRAQPTSTMSGTMHFWNGITTNTATAFSAVFNSVSQGQIDFNSGVGTSGQANTLYTTGGSQYIDFNAEL